MNYEDFILISLFDDTTYPLTLVAVGGEEFITKFRINKN